MYKIIKGSPEDRDHLDDKIVEFNKSKMSFTQENPFVNIDLVVKDNDMFIGGITAVLYCWKCLCINVLWVDEKHRHQGLGKKLLKQAEEEAIKLGCHLSHLDTFDFQAKDFYLKNGYEIFGTLDNCPPGHKRFFFKENFIIM